MVPGETTAPAPTTLPLPITAPSSTTEPIPIRQKSSIVHPCATTPCPNVTESPTVSARAAVTCNVQLSCTLVLLPIRIRLMSPRTTLLNQTLESPPICTSPMIAAPSATNTEGSQTGSLPP